MDGDNRMDFLSNFVKKTLKLKPEKFTRMMGTEEHKAVVMKFIERPLPPLLVIALTATAQLVASNGFPLAQLKSKGIPVLMMHRYRANCAERGCSTITGCLVYF